MKSKNASTNPKAHFRVALSFFIKARSGENGIYFHANEISFSYEWMRMKG